MYLVDTSVLTRLRLPNIANTLVGLGRLYYSSISGLELRFSASNETDYRTLSTILDGFDRLAIADGTFDVADRTQRLLANASLKGRPVPDLIIAAQAELAGLTVLHYDAHFDLIASVTGQPTLWISPPGSID
ncbi:MAG: PIN domain-containing protein [Ilumatobacteraceae bacterium]